MGLRRFLAGADVLLASGLALALLVIVNFLAHRYDGGVDWTRQGAHTLDERTRGVLKAVSERGEKVRIAAFYAPSEDRPFERELVGRVTRLLERYKAQCPALVVDQVHLYDERVKAQALVKEMLQGDPEPNSVVFRCGDRRKSVSEAEMGEFDLSRVKAFKAEDAFTTALGIVLSGKEPKALYVTGHGERPLEGTPTPFGFQGFKELFEHEGVALTAGPTGQEPLEGRFDLVIVAGPGGRLLPEELESLHRFLMHKGRLLLFLDPVVAQAGKGMQPTGLEELVSRWGIAAPDELVIDPKNCITEQGAKLTYYFQTKAFAPDCPLTKGMGEVPLLLLAARPVEVPPGQTPPGVRLRPVVYAERTAWAKRDLRDLVRGRLEVEPNLDRKGPHCLGAWLEIDPEPAPADAAAAPPGSPPRLPADAEKGGRAVVLGDADLASNQLLMIAHPNQGLVYNAVVWLLDRQESMGIAAKSDTVKIVLTDEQRRRLGLWIQFALPVSFLMAGILTLWMRRHG